MANTTQTLGENPKSNKDYQKEMDLTAAAFEQEKKVAFSIPKMMQSSLGSELFIGVNGSHVVVPVDGEEYEIPETLAKHGKEVIKNLR